MRTLPNRLVWVKEDFDRIAVNGFLGDPNGKLAMGYLRVSSTGQAEEGRSGFPRQLAHVHEKARELYLAIPWDLVFFDDHTGFEFRDRPALTQLRELIRSVTRPADDLVIENLDRLSREATWHQGYLLDEIEKQHKVRVHFWKELGSRLERVVYGTITQDRMMTDLERMAAGNIHKAQSGRVTARNPAYGYRFVNSTGGDENVSKDTHYAFNEPEAAVMRKVYCWLVEERATLIEISRRLTEMGIKPPKVSAAWDIPLLHIMVSNTVYKGEFYAHRFTHVKKISKYTGREVIHKIERPRNEWILVPTPALVSAEVWEEAQNVMKENRNKSLRNSQREYLLLSLVYCANCETIKMCGSAGIKHKVTIDGPKILEHTYYRCYTRSHPKHIRAVRGLTCKMPRISAKVLENVVWNTIIDILFDTQRLEQGIERYFSQQKVETTQEEIAFIQSQITELDLEDERLYQAYVAGAFEAEEFATRRYSLKDRRQQLEAKCEQLQQRFSNQMTRQEHTQQILATVAQLKQYAGHQTPFELKRKILMMVVDKIIVHTSEEWFRLEGAISGTFDFSPARNG